MRKIKFTTGGIYHVYNRGNNKRPIFLDVFDLKRFLQSMKEFNARNPIGSIYENSFRKRPESKLGSLASKDRLVDFVTFCLNISHFHFILVQLVDNGIEKFMHRIGTGFTKYFDQKYKLSGSLFQGTYKAKHVDSNEYLLHLSAYINLNDKMHQLGSLASKSFSSSSWKEYISNDNGPTSFCNRKDLVLSQFKNTGEYKKFVESSLHTIKEHKILEDLLKEDGII